MKKSFKWSAGFIRHLLAFPSRMNPALHTQAVTTDVSLANDPGEGSASALSAMETARTWSFRLLALLLVLLMQGPAMFVQELAWGNMLIDYSQERGLARGLVETFDGEHPCELCAAAAKLRQEKDTPSKPIVKRPGHCWSQMTTAAICQLPPPTSRLLFADLPRALIFSEGIGAFAPALPPPLAA